MCVCVCVYIYMCVCVSFGPKAFLENTKLLHALVFRSSDGSHWLTRSLSFDFIASYAQKASFSPLLFVFQLLLMIRPLHSELCLASTMKARSSDLPSCSPRHKSVHERTTIFDLPVLANGHRCPDKVTHFLEFLFLCS